MNQDSLCGHHFDVRMTQMDRSRIAVPALLLWLYLLITKSCVKKYINFTITLQGHRQLFLKGARVSFTKTIN